VRQSINLTLERVDNVCGSDEACRTVVDVLGTLQGLNWDLLFCTEARFRSLSAWPLVCRV
jgi:hypothetical protein